MQLPKMQYATVIMTAMLHPSKTQIANKWAASEAVNQKQKLIPHPAFSNNSRMRVRRRCTIRELGQFFIEDALIPKIIYNLSP